MHFRISRHLLQSILLEIPEDVNPQRSIDFGGATPFHAHQESGPGEFILTANMGVMGQAHAFNEVSTNFIIDFNTTII